MVDTDDKYTQAKNERQKHIDAILSSVSTNKVVVAGPGTGKTYLFKEILKGKTNTLTLTFVNALVQDLSLELCGISDVKTLHSFARSELSRITGDNVKLFPQLSQLIHEDALVLLDKEVDFDGIFNNRDDSNQYISFYKKRKDYYDKYYGYSDVIFAIVKYFENSKNSIPTYQQVIVDEFQDFNKLEVSLIELLSMKSPVLIAGDDDQALYTFKNAKADFIRFKYGNDCPDYEPFTLPYCSRCSRVIVDATNRIISSAINNGLLNDRINKQYQYFEDENKDKESDLNPKIICNQSFAKQIPWLIQQKIEEIAKVEKKSFSVLIISPTKKQLKSIVDGLRKKGFNNIEHVEKGGGGIRLLDGFKLLLSDDKSNLGWRIIYKFILDQSVFNELLVQSNLENAKAICELVDDATKEKVKKILKILRLVKKNEVINDDSLQEALEAVGLVSREILTNRLKEEIDTNSDWGGNPGLNKIPIKATTIQSSKGLSAEYVFITNFDDQYFIKNKDKTIISDQDVCNFLVALTRARKKVVLISTAPGKTPTFLTWIGQDIIQIV